MNNFDLRGGFKLSGKSVTLVAASDRTHKAIALYTIDPETRLLTSVGDGAQATGLSDPYGLCLYRDRKGGTFAFVSDPDGRVRQFQLIASSTGKVAAKLGLRRAAALTVFASGAAVSAPPRDVARPCGSGRSDRRPPRRR